MADINTLVDKLSELTVLEAADLAKALEEKWGVSAAAAVAAGSGRRRRRSGRRGADRVRRHPHRRRRQEDQRDQGSPRDHPARPRRSQGAGRGRAQGRSRKASPRPRPRRSRRRSRKPAAPSSCAKLFFPDAGFRARMLEGRGGSRGAAPFPLPIDRACIQIANPVRTAPGKRQERRMTARLIGHGAVAITQ